MWILEAMLLVVGWEERQSSRTESRVDKDDYEMMMMIQDTAAALE